VGKAQSATGLIMRKLLIALAGVLAVPASSDFVRAQAPQKLFLEGDIVRGNTPDGATGPICVLANQFKRRENVVFRIRVRDTTGKPLDDKSLKSVVVQLMGVQTLQARFASRPPPNLIAALKLPGPIDAWWTAAWRIPQDFPTGTVTYKVTVTDLQGNTQDWAPFNDPRSWPTVLDGEVEFKKP
jgi:hypothetical protein